MAEHPVVLAQVPAPPAPPVIVIDPQPGQVIDLAPAGRDATLTLHDGDLIVTQPGEPSIVVRDLVDAAAADPPPIVQLAEAAVPASDLVERLAPLGTAPVDTLLQVLPPPDLSLPPTSHPTPDLTPPPVTVATALSDPGGLRGDLRDEVRIEPGSVASPGEPSAPAALTIEPSSAVEQDTVLAQLLAASTGGETILGSPGDDVVTLASPIAGVVDLGAGTDTLNLSALANVNLGDPATDYRGIEKIDLRGGSGSEVTLSVADLLDLSPTTDTLLVRGDASDQVVIGGGWTLAGTQSNPQGEIETFSVYTQSIGGATATLLVESSVSVA